jgi:hypothetical protein
MGDRMSDKTLSDLVREGSGVSETDTRGEMREYDPTVRERMASALQSGMEGLGVNRYKARKHAQTIMGGDSSNLPAGMGAADFVPFLGTGLQTEEAARDLGKAGEAAKRGDYIDAGVEGVAGLAGMLPGAHSTIKGAKDMLKKIKAIDLPKLKLIETDSVPKAKKQSLKEWAMAGGGVPESHRGREHVWHKKAQKYAAGGEVYNTVPDMADGGDILDGPAYAGGGAVKKVVKDAVEGVMEGIQKILPRAEADANKAKFLAESKDQRKFYHGNQADIERFIPSRKGVFVSPDPEFASTFSEGATGRHGPNVMPVRVQVKNPFDYDNPAHMKAIREAAQKRYPGNRNIQYELDAIGGVDDSGGVHNNWASVEHPEVQRLIQQLNHDAYYTSEGGTKNLGIYNPNQIKSDIGNRGTYDVTKGDINESHGGAIHMAKGGKLGEEVKDIIKKGIKGLMGDAPKGVEPIVVRTPEERAVIDKFGQKQEQEAVRQKKVEKAAKESAGKSPEESAKPTKSTGKRVAVPPDVYRKMAEGQGDEAVLRAARAGKHLKPTNEGYIGAPRTVTSGQGLGAMRRAMDTDFADSVEAVRLADPERLGTWYDRAKQGIAESVEPYQLPRTLEQHGVYSAGVSPESELTFALKHLNSRVAGEPGMAYRGAGMRNLDSAVAEGRPANMGFKIGEYAEKNDPRVPNAGLFGVNDFRRAQGMGYTDPQGNPWKAGVSDTMHPFMDAETALQVDRANAAGTGGRSDWAGPHIQEVPWVYGKGQDLHGRGLKGRYAGDELEGIKMALRDANNTARDYFYKHTGSATHEAIPGANTGHVPQMIDAPYDQKVAYGNTGRWDVPAPEYELSDMGTVGAGNRDAIYSALGYRQLPTLEAAGAYFPEGSSIPEHQPVKIARPLLDFPTGGGGIVSEPTRQTMEFAERFRALGDAQEAFGFNLPNTMADVKGKNSLVLDTRGKNPKYLDEPHTGVMPDDKQMGALTQALSDTGYGIAPTSRGATVFPFDPKATAADAKRLMKDKGSALQQIYPSEMEPSLNTSGYGPGVGMYTPDGFKATEPFSGQATMGLLKEASYLPPEVAMNLGESERVRSQLKAKMKRDEALPNARADIQETRRFFSEADWPKAVALIRQGYTPAAALAALGYSASSMAKDDR